MRWDSFSRGQISRSLVLDHSPPSLWTRWVFLRFLWPRCQPNPSSSTTDELLWQTNERALQAFFAWVTGWWSSTEWERQSFQSIQSSIPMNTLWTCLALPHRSPLNRPRIPLPSLCQAIYCLPPHSENGKLGQEDSWIKIKWVMIIRLAGFSVEFKLHWESVSHWQQFANRWLAMTEQLMKLNITAWSFYFHNLILLSSHASSPVCIVCPR